MDVPLVEKSKQNTPSFSSGIMAGLAKWKKPKERMLFVLCGAAGFRISEALGIEIDKHISSDFGTISLRQQARHCKVKARLKTTNAVRDVDIHPAIASLLKAFVGERKSGFLFASRNGKPLSSSNIIRRHLHPALKELNYVNPHTGTHKAGNHAFRRFRNTYLKNYLRWRNIDLEKGALSVTHSVYDGHFDIPKTPRSQRSVPLGPKAVQILAARKPAVTNPEGLVFATREGSAFDRHNLTNRQLKSTCNRLGLVGVNWHWLRHANATLLDAVGTPLGTVQALLGHSSSEITREVYLHSIPADARAAVEKVEGLLNRPKLTQVPVSWGNGSPLIQ